MERYIKYTSIIYYIMLVIESAIALGLYIKRLFIKNKRINYKIPVGYTIESGSLEINPAFPERLLILENWEHVVKVNGKSSLLADMMEAIQKEESEIERLRFKKFINSCIGEAYEHCKPTIIATEQSEMNQQQWDFLSKRYIRGASIIEQFVQRQNYINYALMMKAI